MYQVFVCVCVCACTAREWQGRPRTSAVLHTCFISVIKISTYGLRLVFFWQSWSVYFSCVSRDQVRTKFAERMKERRQSSLGPFC